MARQVLPVNFQDDVLNASMNGKRRYMLLQQDDGSYILNDVTNYDTEGSTFGAAQINATNQAVNQSVDKDDVLETMEEIDANTDAGKAAGALAVKELSSELNASKISWKKIREIGVKYNRPTEVTIFDNESDDKISNYDVIVVHTSNQARTTHRNPHYCIIDEKAMESGAFQVIDISPNSASSLTYMSFYFTEKTLVIEAVNATAEGIAIVDIYGIARGNNIMNF